MSFTFGPRRGTYLTITDAMNAQKSVLAKDELAALEKFDLIYRSVCALMYNYVPTSGHPGGSISSGRFVQGIIFDAMNYDLSNPDRPDADIISYAAGHKALGLYALWALRDEIARIGAPSLLPKEERYRLRLEDLLGFRRNPNTDTPLFKKFHAKPLDGHPTPATPFIKLSTGASGVGVTASLGLAFAAADYYGAQAPRVHIVEGEGGMTPGRVAEAFASAGTSSLGNAIIHIDWNQASIDSNRVCRDGTAPGDYVQWTPAEFAYLHDWNVIYVPDGKDFAQIVAAQREAAKITNGQPTAIVYSTVKGWQYGIEGKASHGAGHKLCSTGFYDALATLMKNVQGKLPACEEGNRRCSGDNMAEVMESCFWESLTLVRKVIEENDDMVKLLAARLSERRACLDKLARAPRSGAPRVEAVYEAATKAARETPPELKLKPGDSTTLRGELANALNYYNKLSKGAVLAASADLLGSTNTTGIAKGFPEGFFNAKTNAGARLLSVGGICEDAISGEVSGVSTFGRHIGVGSSYGAFIAPLGHIAVRLHAIGNQSRKHIAPKDAYNPVILVCAHAGLKTGEDGPTHADPQALQLMQENFPKGTIITLTPWDPQEICPLISAAIAKRPAIIAPFVTRPNEVVPDRTALGLADVNDCLTGVYCLRKAKGKGDGTVVLQESGVTYSFVEDALPMLLKDGIDLNVYYVASAELFDMLSPAERERMFPEARAREAMGITGFTLPTMWKWITSERGRAATLHPFKKGHYLGSGPADRVLAEAGLDGESQYKAIRQFIEVGSRK